MDIKHTENTEKGKFFFEADGEEIAFLSYVYAGQSSFIIEHTVVSPQFEGKGYGAKLVMAAVEFARSRSLKIIPLCPYAKSVFDRKPEYADVLLS